MSYSKEELERQMGYVQLPLRLISDPKYKNLSYTSVIVYCLLRNRYYLSLNNGWHDEGGTYIYFRQKDLAEYMDKGLKTIERAFRELKDFGLIDTVSQGSGLPTKIYVNDYFPRASGATSGPLKNDGQTPKKCPVDPLRIIGPYSKKKSIEEKYRRRVEDKPPIAPQRGPGMSSQFREFAGENEELLSALTEWADMRKKIKKPLTDGAVKRNLKALQKLSGGDEPLMVRIVNQSTDHCWAGFYDLKYDGGQKTEKYHNPQIDEIPF